MLSTRWVDDVVLGVPWKITKELLATMPLSCTARAVKGHSKRQTIYGNHMSNSDSLEFSALSRSEPF